MAKRKRLTPAQPSYLAGSAPAPQGGPLGLGIGSPPIAQVASESAAQAALQDLSDEFSAARREGRIIEEVPLEAIEPGHLVRDRIEQDETEMSALMESLRSRGQQMPVDVVELDAPDGQRRYGLISGWRRLTALKRLYCDGAEPEFGSVKIRVIAPETAQSAYLAMVEENEIRVNLSHYERARIVERALQEGVFDTQKTALQGLFGNVPRAKRSKIGSFMTLVRALDDVLYYPTAISEKLGLALVRELSGQPARVADLRQALLLEERSAPEIETAVLQRWLQAQSTPETETVPAEKAKSAPRATPSRVTLAPGLQLRHLSDKGRLELSGAALDDDLVADLQRWLQERVAG